MMAFMKKLTVKGFLILMNDSKVTHSYVAEENYCPIRKRIMTEPVMAADGFTYEKEALLQWLLRNDRSPMTNQKLKNKDWTANHGRKSEISTLLDKQFIKPKDIYVNENTQDLENALHFQLLYPKVKRAFLKFAKVDVTIHWLRDFFIKKADLFRYIADDNKQGLLTIFYGASKVDVSKFFNQKYITEQDLNYMLSGLNLCTVDHIKKIQNRQKYILFLERYGTVKDLIQLPPILIGALLNSAYVDKKSNYNLNSEHKSSDKPIFIIEEKLKSLGVPSLQKFNQIIQLEIHEYSFYENIAIILNGKFGYPIKIIGQPISSQSTERVDLFKLANLNSKVVNCIVENPADLETLLLTDGVDFKELVNIDPNFLAFILNDNSEEATTLLNTKKTDLNELNQIPSKKLKIILRKKSKILSLLKEGVEFNLFSRLPNNILESLLPDKYNSDCLPILSFLIEIEITITDLNDLDPNHPALDWFLKNIQSLELTYNHENQNEFKEIIDHAVKRNDSINELITLISRYNNWPTEYHIEHFIQQEEKGTSSIISTNKNTLANANKPKQTHAENGYENTTRHLETIPKQTNRITAKNNWVGTQRTYTNYSSSTMTSPNPSTSPLTKTYVFMLMTYGLGALIGIGGETYHLLSQYRVSNSNKPLVISLLAISAMFLFIGFLIQQMAKNPPNKYNCCSLNRFSNITLFVGIISVAGSAISLYFDANKFNLILFLAASVLMISSVIIKTIIHNTPPENQHLTDKSTMVLD